MQTPKVIREEHKKAVAEMTGLIRAANDKDQDFPVGHDYELYCR